MDPSPGARSGQGTPSGGQAHGQFVPSKPKPAPPKRTTPDAAVGGIDAGGAGEVPGAPAASASSAPKRKGGGDAPQRTFPRYYRKLVHQLGKWDHDPGHRSHLSSLGSIRDVAREACVRHRETLQSGWQADEPLADPESKGMAYTKSMEEQGLFSDEQQLQPWMDICEAAVMW